MNLKAETRHHSPDLRWAKGDTATKLGFPRFFNRPAPWRAAKKPLYRPRCARRKQNPAICIRLSVLGEAIPRPASVASVASVGT